MLVPSNGYWTDHRAAFLGFAPLLLPTSTSLRDLCNDCRRLKISHIILHPR